MEKKIEEIKNELKAAYASELPAFVEQYGTDKRSGVQALVAKARKMIDAYAVSYTHLTLPTILG